MSNAASTKIAAAVTKTMLLATRVAASMSSRRAAIFRQSGYGPCLFDFDQDHGSTAYLRDHEAKQECQDFLLLGGHVREGGTDEPIYLAAVDGWQFLEKRMCSGFCF